MSSSGRCCHAVSKMKVIVLQEQENVSKERGGEKKKKGNGKERVRKRKKDNSVKVTTYPDLAKAATKLTKRFDTGSSRADNRVESKRKAMSSPWRLPGACEFRLDSGYTSKRYR